MKMTKKNMAIRTLFAAGMLIPVIGIANASEEKTIEQKVSEAVPSEQSASTAIETSEKESEGFFDKAKAKINALIGKDESNDIKEQAEQKLETATESQETKPESIVDTTKEKIDTLAEKTKNSEIKGQAEKKTEAAKETITAAADSSKEKLNTVVKETVAETKAEIKTEEDIKQQAQIEPKSEEGFLGELKSKVKELTSKDSDGKIEDEAFVSDI